MPKPAPAFSFGLLDSQLQPIIAAVNDAAHAAGIADRAAADIGPVNGAAQEAIAGLQAVQKLLQDLVAKLQAEASALANPPVPPPPAP